MILLFGCLNNLGYCILEVKDFSTIWKLILDYSAYLIIINSNFPITNRGPLALKETHGYHGAFHKAWL